VKAAPQPGVFSRFADDATEARYVETARTLRLPFVRLYCGIFVIVALAYSVVNPMLVPPADNARLAILLGAMVLLAGAYICVTFWEGYVRQPLIDFGVLLLLSILIGKVNFVLFEHFGRLDETLHAIGVINRLALTGFAAVTLAGKPRLFLCWLGADMLGWLGMVITDLGHLSFPYAAISYFSGAAMMIAINLAVGRTSRSAFKLADGLDSERRRNEELVHNMLPLAAVQRIRDGRVVADSYADVSVIFIDMIGFSLLTKRISPGHLVELLNTFFNHADRCAGEHGVEKVKTVGDSYLAIAGGNLDSVNSADSAIAFSRAVMACVPELRRVAGVDTIGLRVGIHSGPVVGGVIGATRMAYDYWGDTVNVAARLQGNAPINGIAISESTWLRTTDRARFGPPEAITLKGIGETLVYTAGFEPGEESADEEPVAA
jgi:adenylate cyclase